jgi:hypothetical protein
MPYALTLLLGHVPRLELDRDVCTIPTAHVLRRDCTIGEQRAQRCVVRFEHRIFECLTRDLVVEREPAERLSGSCSHGSLR